MIHGKSHPSEHFYEKFNLKKSLDFEEDLEKGDN